MALTETKVILYGGEGFKKAMMSLPYNELKDFGSLPRGGSLSLTFANEDRYYGTIRVILEMEQEEADEAVQTIFGCMI